VALIAPRSSVAPASASIGSRDDVRSRKRRSDPASLDCLSIGRSTKRDDDRNAHARNASPPYSARSGIRGKTIASIPDPVVRLKCASSSLSSPYLSLFLSLSLSLSLALSFSVCVSLPSFLGASIRRSSELRGRTDGRTDGRTEGRKTMRFPRMRRAALRQSARCTLANAECFFIYSREPRPWLAIPPRCKVESCRPPERARLFARSFAVRSLHTQITSRYTGACVRD
jgi:hypothetical protein